MCCEAIPCGRDALAEPVCNVIGAEEAYENVRQVERTMENTAPAAEERISRSKRTRGPWQPGSGERA